MENRDGEQFVRNIRAGHASRNIWRRLRNVIAVGVQLSVSELHKDLGMGPAADSGSATSSGRPGDTAAVEKRQNT